MYGNYVDTNAAAEAMLEADKYFTSKSLAEKLNITAKKASGLLYNIRTTNKYETIETPLPNREVKVISIKGSKISRNKLWDLALNLKTHI